MNRLVSYKSYFTIIVLFVANFCSWAKQRDFVGLLFLSVHNERASQLSMRTEHAGWSTWMLYCEQNLGHLCSTGRYDWKNIVQDIFVYLSKFSITYAI